MAGEEVRALAEVIAGMTVKQASALSEYLRAAHGIGAARGAVVVSQAVVEPTPDVTGRSGVVDVVLTDAGPKKISVIKVVRAATGLGLKEAKDLVDGAPRVVKAGVERAEAERLRGGLEREGARVELR